LRVEARDLKEALAEQILENRLLKAHDLITSPAFIVIKAANEFRDKTSAPNQLWRTDFTYFKVIGWGWFYLSTILDDDSRYIIAWKLCTTMKADDVTATLKLALETSGCNRANVVNHRYHESIGNVTPSDAYFGRHTAIIEKREKIKKLTIQSTRLNHQQQAA